MKFMKPKKRIENILSNNFKSWTIEVIDISQQHKGHNHFSGNNETHFSIILYKNNNEDFKRIDIHRKLNNISSYLFNIDDASILN